MPFITKERRDVIDGVDLSFAFPLGEIMPGDRCYVFYKKMVEKWKENPRWTTAHEIYKEMRNQLHGGYSSTHNVSDDDAARELAWQVFFIKYVIPYEKQKEIENGDI